MPKGTIIAPAQSNNGTTTDGVKSFHYVSTSSARVASIVGAIGTLWS